MSDSISVGNISNSQGIAIGRNATVNVYPPPKFPLDNLPPPNLAFTGRQEELAAIVANFSDTAGSPIVLTQAIAGLGGVGKTQLALAYAHAYRGEYDLIWQLRVDDTLTLDTDLRQLGEVLNLPVREKDTPTMRRILLSWLNGSEQRWLLLFDNADQIKPRDLRPYLPSGGGHLLITSRRDTAQWQRIAHTLTLDVFTALEAAAFWQKRGLKSEPALADLAEALGHLPLAMEQAAAYMSNRYTGAAIYLKQFQKRRQELWAKEDAPDDYHATIMTTWQMAFDHARQTAGAAALLNLCCFLAPNDIPLNIIQEQAQTLPDELAGVMADELALADALAALQNYSLITHADGMLNIHRLVQAVARERMGAERAKVWMEITLILLTKAYHFDEYDMNTWAQCSQLLPHVITVANLAAKWKVNSKQAAYLNSEAGLYLQKYGDYAVARPFLERALAIDLGSDHPDTATSYNNLGGLLKEMGKYREARTFFEHALAIWKVQPDHLAISIGLNNLGILLKSMGEYKEALSFHEQALAIQEKQLGSNHPGTAISLNNLGALLESMGEYKEALSFHEQALAIREKQLGSNHPDTAISLNNLGALLESMEKYEEARLLYERALAIWEVQLGSEHPDIATGLNNLGALLQSMGEYKEARSFHERALAIQEKQLGSNHPSTAISLNGLGTLLRSIGEYEEALPFHERALAIWEAQLGSDHSRTATGLNNLGLLLQAEGKYEEARPFHERALVIWEAQLGSNHPEIATRLNDLGELLRVMENYEDARPFLERALAIWEAELGIDHPNVATFNNNLGELLRVMENYEDARPFLERALAIWEAQLGLNHPQTAIGFHNLALLSYNEGNKQEATRLMRRALAIREKALGNDHPNTQSSRRGLAVIETVLGGKRWQFWKRR